MRANVPGLVSVLVLSAALAGCGGNTETTGARCGAGTTEVAGECVATGTGGAGAAGTGGAGAAGAGAGAGGAGAGGVAGKSGAGGGSGAGGSGAIGGASGSGAGGGAGTGGASCVDTLSDLNNCGSCGHVCPHLPGTTGACAGGECTYVCGDGYADCDGDLTSLTGNGCEVSLATDAAHCGKCDKKCSAGGPSMVGVCQDGACGVGCATGHADCDNQDTNGCEVTLESDASNCGECGNACTAACTAGSCAGEPPLCAIAGGAGHHAVAFSLAAGSNGFALLWLEEALYPHGKLWLTTLDASGKAAGAPRLVADVNTYDRFDVAFDGVDYGVAWSTFYPQADTSNILYTRRFAAADGAPLGAPAMTTLTGGVFTLFLRPAAAGFALFAGSIGAGQVGLVGADGAVGSLATITSTTPSSGGITNVVGVNGGFLALWSVSHDPGAPIPSKWGVGTLFVSGAGAPVGATKDIDPTVDGQGQIAATNGTAIVTLAPGISSILPFGSLHARPLDAQGNPGGSWAPIGDSTKAYGLTSAAIPWLLTVGGAKLLAQGLSATATKVGSPLALAKMPSNFGQTAAATSAQGTLFAWLRGRQLGTMSQQEVVIEGALLGADGVVSSPCE